MRPAGAAAKNALATTMAERRAGARARFAWLDAVQAASLSPSAFMIAYRLSSHAKWASGELTVWPSQETLQAATGLDVRTIRRALNDLEAAGFVTKQQARGRGAVNRYELKWPDKNALSNAALGGQICPPKGEDDDRAKLPSSPDNVAPLAGQECGTEQCKEPLKEPERDGASAPERHAPLALQQQGIATGKPAPETTLEPPTWEASVPRGAEFRDRLGRDWPWFAGCRLKDGGGGLIVRGELRFERIRQHMDLIREFFGGGFTVEVERPVFKDAAE